jgi:hypothetical protein
VFLPDGSYRPSYTDTTFADGSGWLNRAKKYHEHYEPGYADQARYLNRRLLEVIDGILASSPTRPVILIQGDHGPGGHLDWGSKSKSSMPERMSILSAYLVPDPSRLYPSITPVNSFRVVFDEVLGTHLPLVPDRSWFELWGRPYGFIDVTDELRDPDAVPAVDPNAKAKKPSKPKVPKTKTPAAPEPEPADSESD